MDAFGYAADLLELELRLNDPAREWTPLPHQIPPEGDWFLWMLFGGRGTGKTDGCAHYIDDHVNGPPCIPSVPGGHRPAIIAPTLGDALEACVNGPSGLRVHNPGVRSVQRAGGTYVIWPNGTEAKVFGAFTPEDVERLRAGGNRCIAWAEELAAWRYLDECWNHMRFGLRLGPRPRVVAGTTPKPRPRLKQLLNDPKTAITHGTTDDNPHLNPEIRQALISEYGGTRLGQQELLGQLLEDVEGALWKRDWIHYRAAPDLVRVVVAVDPAVSSKSTSAETGIIVCGRGVDGKGYVLADWSMRGTPEEWGRRVLRAYWHFEADAIVGEINNGHELVRRNVEASLRNDETMPPFEEVWASRGKQIRAEQISTRYEKGKDDPDTADVYHVEPFEELEDQYCNWVPDQEDSPDRLDAAVWGLSKLLVGRPSPVKQETAEAITGGQFYN